MIKVIKKIHKDNHAQFLLFEAILVTGLIFVTLYFVQGFNTVTYDSTREKNVLFEKGITTLNTLDGYGKSSEYDSQLVQYLETNDTYNFSVFLFNSVFPCISYRIYIFNISQSLLDNVPINKTQSLWYKSDTPEIGKKASVYKIYVYRGYVKEVLVDMWYI